MSNFNSFAHFLYFPIWFKICPKQKSNQKVPTSTNVPPTAKPPPWMNTKTGNEAVDGFCVAVNGRKIFNRRQSSEKSGAAKMCWGTQAGGMEVARNSPKSWTRLGKNSTNHPMFRSNLLRVLASPIGENPMGPGRMECPGKCPLAGIWAPHSAFVWPSKVAAVPTGYEILGLDHFRFEQLEAVPIPPQWIGQRRKRQIGKGKTKGKWSICGEFEHKKGTFPKAEFVGKFAEFRPIKTNLVSSFGSNHLRGMFAQQTVYFGHFQFIYFPTLNSHLQFIQLITLRSTGKQVTLISKPNYIN